MTQDRNTKNKKRRATLARRRLLFDRLKLQAELAFESNSIDAAYRAFSTLLELLDRPLNNQRRKALATVLENSGYVDQDGYRPQIDTDGDCLTISGSFSFKDLSSKLVWEMGTPEMGIPETVEG